MSVLRLCDRLPNPGDQIKPIGASKKSYWIEFISREGTLIVRDFHDSAQFLRREAYPLYEYISRADGGPVEIEGTE